MPDDIESNETANPLRDIEALGKEKPFGYVDESVVLQMGSDLETLRMELVTRGRIAKIVKKDEGKIRRTEDALYVADRQALGDLVRENSAIIQEAGWPTDPEIFFDYVGRYDARPKTKLFDVIADGFGDKANIGRTDVQSPPGYQYPPANSAVYIVPKVSTKQ